MNSYKKIIFNTFSCDIWHELQKTQNPILIYGMGNGADKIISVFERYGIEYSDIFASDGFVRGHLFRGKRVISYSEALEKYGSFDIVVSFGTRLPDVMDRIFALENTHTVYAPDVPVTEGEIFTEEFFDKHCDELFFARELFQDEESKRIFDDIVRFKLTGRLSYLRSTECSEDKADSHLQLEKYEVYVDLGAYNGDTVKKYSALCPNLNTVYAFEPDKRNFKKLNAFCQELDGIHTKALNCAAYSHDTTLLFSASGNRNSSAASLGSFQHKTVEIEARAPDSVCEKADFIKYDVEGLEYESLLGSRNLISKFKPDLLVSMYHKSEDLYMLPSLTKKLYDGYSLFLLRLPYIPAWDLNMYAISKK